LARRTGAGVADPRLPRWAGAGSGPLPAVPRTGGSRIASAWASPKASPSSARTRRSGSNANAGELGGVSFTKGCYVGQENTARMHYRAKVNRRLVVAPIAEPGDRTRAIYPDLGAT
jgi:folate-binding protein YgfZ